MILGSKWLTKSVLSSFNHTLILLKRIYNVLNWYFSIYIVKRQKITIIFLVLADCIRIIMLCYVYPYAMCRVEKGQYLFCRNYMIKSVINDNFYILSFQGRRWYGGRMSDVNTSFCRLFCCLTCRKSTSFCRLSCCLTCGKYIVLPSCNL